MKKYLILALLLLTGCETEQEKIDRIDAYNRSVLASTGHQMGTLKDGRVLTVFQLELPDESKPLYAIVCLDAKTSSISINSIHTEGSDDDKVDYRRVVAVFENPSLEAE